MNKNLKAVYKYNLITELKPTSKFYMIVLAIIIMFGATSFFTGTSGSFQLSGFEVASIIFLFVLATSEFKENFEMLLQNGSNRQEIYIGKLLSYTTLVLITSSIDRILAIVIPKIGFFNKHMVFESLFSQMVQSHYSSNKSLIIRTFLPLALAFSISILSMYLGTLISILFYRTNQIGKISIAAGIPIFIFVLIPALSYHMQNRAIATFVSKVVKLFLSTPIRLATTFFCLSLVLAVVNWTIVKRAVVKGN